MEISALLFEAVKKLVFTAISKKVSYQAEKFLLKRKIESHIEDSVAKVVEQLLPFFENEKITSLRRELLIHVCNIELNEILKSPQELFASALDGQKIFDRRYQLGILPTEILEEGLKDTYAAVFPQIANLICAYPVAVDQWRIEGYRDNFRRLDEIAITLGNVAIKLDGIATRDQNERDLLRARLRKFLAQRVEFQLDLTGLRGDRPDAVPLEKCFIVPAMEGHKKGGQEIDLFLREDEITKRFTSGSVRSIVVGPPGVGKSTWSLWLQRKILTRKEAGLGILVRLRELVQRNPLPSLFEIVSEAAGVHLRQEITPSNVHDWCIAGTLTLILDGFDEIAPSKRDLVAKWIKELDLATESASLIVTSRPLTTPHLDEFAESWDRMALSPFNETRVVEYIKRWYENAPLLTNTERVVDAESLASQWLEDSVLQPLATIPLMLATLLMVHHMDGQLPRGRSKVYERYVDGMLGLWDSRWGIASSIDLSLQLKKRILTKLALFLHIEDLDQIGDNEINSLMERVLRELGCNHSAPQVLDHLRERSGLLIGPGTWSFVHKSVAEYLVATAVVDGDQADVSGQSVDRLRLFNERHNDRWNTVLFFWGGLTSVADLQSFIDQLLGLKGNSETSLALGLLFDQWQPYRLPKAWREARLAKILIAGFRAKKENLISFSTDLVPAAVDIEIPVPTIAIRSIEQSFLSSFGHNAIRKCLQDSDLRWKDLHRTHKSFKTSVWLDFVCNPASEDELRLLLDQKKITNLVGALQDRILIALTWGMTGHSYKRGPSIGLKSFISTFRELVPETSNKILFCLAAHFVNAQQLVADEKGEDVEDVKFLVELFEVISEEKAYEFDLEWMNKDAHIYLMHENARDTVNLFESFVEAVEYCCGKGWIAEGALKKMSFFLEK